MVSPFEYQQKLLKDAESENQASQDRLAFLIADEIYPWQTGTVVGPYCTFTDYFMTNGELITMVSLSSLFWAQPLNSDY